MIPVLRYQKPIGADGVQFCVTLAEGDCRADALGRNAFRLETENSSYLVLYRDESEHVAAGGVATDAECACIRFAGSSPEPIRAWIIKGRQLKINGQTWLDSDVLRSVELAESLAAR